MKTLILKISALICVAFLLVTAFSATSCKKDEMCHGNITVIDTSGAVVPGATVIAEAPSVNGQVAYSNVTDGSGVAYIGLKLPAILDIRATSASYPGMVAKGILRLDEPGKTAEVTVTLKP
jgi:hypothetical protein